MRLANGGDQLRTQLKLPVFPSLVSPSDAMNQRKADTLRTAVALAYRGLTPHRVWSPRGGDS